MGGREGDEAEAMGDETGCVGEVMVGRVISVFEFDGGSPGPVVRCRTKYATASGSVTGNKTFSLSSHQFKCFETENPLAIWFPQQTDVAFSPRPSLRPKLEYLH